TSDQQPPCHHHPHHHVITSSSRHHHHRAIATISQPLKKASVRVRLDLGLAPLRVRLVSVTSRVRVDLENSFEVLKLLENSVNVLKILENKLESMKILENKLKPWTVKPSRERAKSTAEVMVIDKSWTLLERHEKAFYMGLTKFVDDCKPLVNKGQKFNMRAMVLWTINDFPARSSLSGWSGQEALEGGPIRPRWMFPFDRFMKKLKGYVRNKSKSEGSIAKGYVAAEVLTFSCYYFQEVTTKFNRPDRNVD
nr:hypothetical protein [Tanacetum cinerariifolium]